MASHSDPIPEPLDRALRQIRRALGSGVILYGLDVRVDSDQLLIEPGLAVDEHGTAIALDEPLSLPFPDGGEERWLALRHADADMPSATPEWLGSPPTDGLSVPVARLVPGRTGWFVDRSAARRAQPFAAPDGAAMPAEGSADFHALLSRLENAVASEFAKVAAQQQAASERARLLALELEELRAEVALVAEQLPEETSGAWPQALAELRDELSITAGEELRAELEQLRADHLALAQRPTLPEPDLGSYTPIGAIHGVGESFALKLNEVGVYTVSDLLAAAADPQWRRQVGGSGVNQARLRRWAREADLLRLHGAGPTEVAMLTDAGITGSAALATVEAPALYKQLVEIASARGQAPPAYAWLLSWIEQARVMPPVVGWSEPQG